MEIKKLDFQALRNEGNFFFHTEVRDLIAEMNPQTLKIQPLFEKYQTALDNLDEAMEQIRKSALTKEIEEADVKRDSIFRGMCDFVKAMTNHFDEDKIKAATRIQIVLDTYGNVTKKPFFEETAAVYNLLQELQQNYEAETEKINLNEWVEALEKRNNQFKILLGDRYEESAAKTPLKVKEVRPQIDDLYRKIVRSVEGLFLLDESDVYVQFIKRLNLIVDKNNNLLAQRKGGKKMVN